MGILMPIIIILVYDILQIISWYVVHHTHSYRRGCLRHSIPRLHLHLIYLLKLPILYIINLLLDVVLALKIYVC